MYNFVYCSDGEVDGPVLRRESARRAPLRHALSEVLPNEDPRRRNQTMTEVKEHAYGRLQEELNIAQSVSSTNAVTSAMCSLILFVVIKYK